jgi:hypothetical protein
MGGDGWGCECTCVPMTSFPQDLGEGIAEVVQLYVSQLTRLITERRMTVIPQFHDKLGRRTIYLL